MAEAARSNVSAHYDAAVSSIIDSIAGFDHRTNVSGLFLYRWKNYSIQ